jgi:hypothetical protein
VDNTEEEAQESPSVFEVGVKECVEGEVVEISKCFEVFNTLEAHFVAVSCFLKVLLAHVIKVNEVVGLVEHAGDLFETFYDDLNEVDSLKFFKRFDLSACDLLGLLNKNLVCFFVH